MDVKKTVLSVELTAEQEKWLRLFAENQHEGAKDNGGTRKPLHLVQRKIYKEIPYTAAIEETFDGERVYYLERNSGGDEITDNCFKDWFEAVREYHQNYDEEFFIADFDGEDIEYSCDQNDIDYDDISIYWKIADWETVAYFWILDSAKEYLKYQSHNLGEGARTYTVYMGYGNKGEYEAFFDLLMVMGTKLIK